MSDWSKYAEKMSLVGISAPALQATLGGVLGGAAGAGEKLGSVSKTALSMPDIHRAAVRIGSVAGKAGKNLESVGSTAVSVNSVMPHEKQASLVYSLEVLYAEYGPPKTKHAAANYFFYEANKDSRMLEALGAPFCKLANASGMDPWDMASGVVTGYENFLKMAHYQGAAGDLARFYLQWTDEVEKRANILTGIGNLASKGWNAAKAGGGALKNSLQSSKRLATQGIIKSEQPTVRKAVGESLGASRALQAEGGGSIRRGRALAAQDAAQAQRTGGLTAPTQAPGKAPLPTHQTAPNLPAQGQAPAPAPTPNTTAPAQGQAPAPAPAQGTPGGWSTENMLIGGGLLGLGGLGAGYTMSGDPTPQYGGY